MDGPQITVGVMNVRRGLASADRIVQVVQDAGIDVLVVIELTIELDDDLGRAGLAPPPPIGPRRTEQWVDRDVIAVTPERDLIAWLDAEHRGNRALLPL